MDDSFLIDSYSLDIPDSSVGLYAGDLGGGLSLPLAIAGPSTSEGGDVSGSTGTSAVFAVGQSARGYVSTYGDHDWYRVQLQAGHTYTFAAIGTGLDALNDTYLSIRNASGIALAVNDDSGPGTSSVIGMPSPLGSGIFTAAYTGIYYIDVGAYNNSSLGQYGVSVVESSATNNYKAGFDVEMGAGSIHTSVNYPGAPYDWNQLTGGVRGTGINLTYSFRDTMTYASANGTFSKCTAAEMSAVSDILALYSEVCNLTFTRVAPMGYSNNGQLAIANYSQPSSAAGAYAYFPSNASNGSGGDLWLNTAAVNPNTVVQGSYSWFAIMHELGHALGLSHPGDYNAGSGTPTYLNAAQFIQDSEQYSIMSYWSGSDTGQSPGAFATAASPLLFDIYELQTLYGVNSKTRAGDTVYGFNNTAGSTYAFELNMTPYVCIWDGSGSDTLDASGYTQNQLINLTPGTFSNIGAGLSNVSIALGAIIENAKGGSGNDGFSGNSANNFFDGGAGWDTVVYSGALTEYRVSAWEGGIQLHDTVSGRDATDTLVNIEAIQFSGMVYTLNYQNGSTGLDYARFNGAVGEYRASVSTAGVAVMDNVANRDGIQILANIERASFVDVNMAFDTGAGQNAGEAYRLYRAALDRAPDLPGLGGWIKVLDSGGLLTTVASGFLGSQEFMNKYGGPNPSNEDLVTLLYQNVLHRAPDPAGLAGWLKNLEGGQSRESVLIGFSESTENMFQTAELVANGIQYQPWV